MAKTLEAHDKLIREIFEGSYPFEIPDYQRPYAWTTEQATELFDDLYSAMQDARVSGASSQYFLGSIVLIKNDRDPKSSVVDGQQRLSTLTMLFAVLRTVMPDAADDITDFLYKKGKVSLGEKNEYRLTAREEDADFFRTNIQEPGGIAQLVASTDKLKDSRLRYRENATLLLEKAKVLPPAELIALWQFLANDCSLHARPRSRVPHLLRTQQPGARPRAYRHHQGAGVGTDPHHGRRRQEPRLRQRVESDRKLARP